MHDVWQASSYFTTVLLGFQYRIVDKGATCCLQVVDCGVSGNEESGEGGGVRNEWRRLSTVMGKWRLVDLEWDPFVGTKCNELGDAYLHKTVGVVHSPLSALGGSQLVALPSYPSPLFFFRSQLKANETQSVLQR